MDSPYLTAEEAAEVADLEAVIEFAKQIEQAAGAELRRIKQAAQDREDAALVADYVERNGEVEWSELSIDDGTKHVAIVNGFPVKIWNLHHDKTTLYHRVDPDDLSTRTKIFTNDLDVAKMRALAKALRRTGQWWDATPRSGIRFPGRETLTVWAATRQGALWSAARAQKWPREAITAVWGDCKPAKEAPCT